MSLLLVLPEFHVLFVCCSPSLASTNLLYINYGHVISTIILFLLKYLRLILKGQWTWLVHRISVRNVFTVEANLCYNFYISSSKAGSSLVSLSFCWVDARGEILDQSSGSSFSTSHRCCRTGQLVRHSNERSKSPALHDEKACNTCQYNWHST